MMQKQDTAFTSIHQCHSVMRNKTTVGFNQQSMGSSRAMSAPLKTMELHDFPQLVPFGKRLRNCGKSPFF